MLDKLSNQKLISTEENDDDDSLIFDDCSQSSGEDCLLYEFSENYDQEPIYAELKPLHPSIVADAHENQSSNSNSYDAFPSSSADADSLDGIPPLEPVSLAEDEQFRENNNKLSSLILSLYEPNSSLFLNLVENCLNDLQNPKALDSHNNEDCENFKININMEQGPLNNNEKLVDWNDMEELNTRDIAERVTSELKRLNISQLLFAQKILGRSQGTLSELLRNPRPWAKMKSGRETFGRMLKWLHESDAERLSILAPNSKQTSQAKFVTIK